jgi:hypothetical protein
MKFGINELINLVSDRLHSKKEATMIDLIVVIVGLFGFSLVLLILYFILNAMVVPFQNSGMNTSYLTNGETSVQLMDSAVPYIFFLLGTISLIFAWYLRTHPIFLLMSLFVMIFGFLPIVTLSNTMISIYQSTAFSNILYNLPGIQDFWQNKIIVGFIAFGVLMLIVLHGKPSQV